MRVTDSGGMTTSEFTNADTQLKVEDEKKCAATSSYSSKTDVGRYLEIFAAELIGTGFLLCVGCGACIQVDDSKPLSDFHSAIGFAFIVSAVIAFIGHITAAHLNPAVTIAFYFLGQVNAPTMLVYFLAETLGAVMGFGLLVLLSPDGWITSDTCVTQPHDSITSFQAAGIEFLATMILIFVICGLTDERCANHQDSTSLKFAGLLIALSLSMGKFTGASMNPVRSLGPAIWTGNWNQHWIYWIAPLSAAVVTPLFYTTCFARQPQT